MHSEKNILDNGNSEPCWQDILELSIGSAHPQRLYYQPVYYVGEKATFQKHTLSFRTEGQGQIMADKESINSRVDESELMPFVLHIQYDEILWANINRIVNERASEVRGAKTCMSGYGKQWLRLVSSHMTLFSASPWRTQQLTSPLDNGIIQSFVKKNVAKVWFHCKPDAQTAGVFKSEPIRKPVCSIHTRINLNVFPLHISKNTHYRIWKELHNTHYGILLKYWTGGEECTTSWDQCDTYANTYCIQHHVDTPTDWYLVYKVYSNSFEAEQFPLHLTGAANAKTLYWRADLSDHWVFKVY